VGHRKITRGGEREELLGASLRGRTTLDRPGSKNVSDHLLTLQRSHGNAAVTVVVQRERKSRWAASTDAPKGTPKPEKPAPKAPAAANFFPTSRNEKFKNESKNDTLRDRGLEYANMKDKNSASLGTELLEEYWFRVYLNKPPASDSRSIAMNLGRAYTTIGDTPRKDFWFAESRRRPDPAPGAN
jgi:hypothetical protein